MLLCTGLWYCKPDVSVNQDFDIPAGKALTTSNDVENALQSAFSILRSEDCYGGAWVVWPELLSDNFQLNPNFAGPLPERNIFLRRLLATDTLIAHSWRSGYRAINLANAILDAVARQSINDAEFGQNKARFLGDAHFIRATAHFELLRLFAPQYTETTRNLPAIPINKTYSNQLVTLSRSSLEEVYAQVISDLNQSIDFLMQAGAIRYFTDDTAPIGSGYKIFNRPTVHVARSFKARVLCQMATTERYAQALAEINQIIEDRTNETFNSDSIDLLAASNPQKYYPQPYPLFGSNLDSWPSMFYFNIGKFVQASYSGSPNYEFIFSMMNFRNDNAFTNRSQYLASRYAMSRDQSFLNTDPPFALGINPGTRLFRRTTDRRVRSFLINTATKRITLSNGSVPAFNKFNNLIFNIPVVRSADLLLMRAEANLALGAPRKALYDLLFVKYRANTAPQDTVQKYYDNLSSEDFPGFLEREIVRERRRELLGEGDRLHTLRRKRMDIPAGDRGEGLPWDASQLIFPIPSTEVSVNSKL